MPSTFTDNLRLEQQGIGENNNTWGNRLNETIAAIDQAIAGTVDVPLSSGTEVLEALNNDVDEARNKVLRLTGTLTDNVVVQVPEASKEYVVWDTTSRAGNTVTLRLGSSGATATITPGRVSHLVTDGTQWVEAVPLGTGDDDVRTNSQNDGRFFRQSENLAEADAPTVRANIDVAPTADVTAAQDAADAAQSTADTAQSTADTHIAEGVSESPHGMGSAAGVEANQNLRTTDTVQFGRITDADTPGDGDFDSNKLGYWEATVELGNDFDAGQEVFFSRVGRTVTLTTKGVLTHNETSFARSVSGAAPSWAIPSDGVRNAYSGTSNTTCVLAVQVDGQLIFELFEPRTNINGAASITYHVDIP